MTICPELSIVVPAFNERWRITPTLLSMIHFLESRAQNYEIIVVDDGSSDDTAKIVQDLSETYCKLSILKHSNNKGKGAAVKTGLLAAQGDRVLFADADGSTPIEELSRLESELVAGADIAIGSRALSSQDTIVATRIDRKFLGRCFNQVVNLLLLPGIADTQCGFKLLNRKAATAIAKQLSLPGFSFDIELLFIAKNSGFVVKEVPINWTNMPGSKVNVLSDGLKMLRDVFIIRWRHKI